MYTGTCFRRMVRSFTSKSKWGGPEQWLLSASSAVSRLMFSGRLKSNCALLSWARVLYSIFVSKIVIGSYFSINHPSRSCSVMNAFRCISLCSLRYSLYWYDNYLKSTCLVCELQNCWKLTSGLLIDGIIKFSLNWPPLWYLPFVSILPLWCRFSGSEPLMASSIGCWDDFEFSRERDLWALRRWPDWFDFWLVLSWLSLRTGLSVLWCVFCLEGL